MGSTNKTHRSKLQSNTYILWFKPKRDTITKTNNHINKRVLNIHVKKRVTTPL